jgi:2'-5' RNA ligase
MQDFGDGVMVALLPIVSDWAQIEFPHLTLVWAGSASEMQVSAKDELAKAALSLALLSRPVTLRTLTKDVFGDGTADNPKVDVLRFHPNLDLFKMRSILESWNASDFPFNPHVTVGPVGTWNGVSPVMVAFDRVAFCVGDERQEFRMSTSFDTERGDW